MRVKVAPASGALSVSMRPPTSASRSRMLKRPKPPDIPPALAHIASGSKPAPESLTTTSTWSSPRLASRTWTLDTRACLTTLTASSNRVKSGQSESSSQNVLPVSRRPSYPRPRAAASFSTQPPRTSSAENAPDRVYQSR